MTQALYRKWRPHRWEQVVGQEHIIQTLRNAVVAGRVVHAYLFAGPRGTGKTTTARLLAKAVNCLSPDLASRPCDQCDHCKAVNESRFLDLIEIDAASNTSVDDVRSLREKINFSPNQGRYKVYIIDEVHMLSTAAFNALLKTLEEPPAHALFILATTEIHKIPATVLSRCQRHEFRRIPVNTIVALLKEMAESEQIKVDGEALTLVARQSTGCMRDAISLLDQLASTGGQITLEIAQQVLGTAASQAVRDIAEAIISRDPKAGLEVIHAALDSGSDPRQFARQIVDYLRNLLLVRMGSASQVDVSAEARAQMARQAQVFTQAELLRVMRAFNYAATDARLSWQPSLPLEMALVEAVEPPVTEARSANPEGASPRQEKPVHPPRQAPASPPAQASSPSGEDSSSSEIVSSSPASEGGLTMDIVHERWKQVLSIVKKTSPNTQGLLNSCKLLGIKDGVLYLGFDSDLVKAKMEKAENVELTRQALSQVYGMDLPFRCIVAVGKRAALPPDVDSDGMVATALRDLGGEIVDIQ